MRAAPSIVSLIGLYEGRLGFANSPIETAFGRSSVARSSSLVPSSSTKKLTPVMLPPGRPKLSTTPAETGSSPIENTIGIGRLPNFADFVADGREAPITANLGY